MGIRPLQLDVTEGVSNNTTVPTLGKVEDMIGVENLWDRDISGTPFLKPYNAGDHLHLNDEESTSFTTNEFQIFKNSAADVSPWSASAVAGDDANLNLIRSRGTIASPLAVQDGDLIGNINFIAASDTSNFNNGAEIRAEINGIPITGVLPCDLVFYVNAGAGVATEGMRLVKDKKLAVDFIHELTGSAGVIIEDLLHLNESIAGTNVSIVADSGTLLLDSQNALSIQADTSMAINPDKADADITIKSPSSDYFMFFDMSTNRIGILNNAPTVAFDITGAVKATNIESANMYTVGGTSINANSVLDLTSDEVTQLANIGATTIDLTQWTVVGTLNQSLATNSNVEFASVVVDGLTINNNAISTTSQNITITTQGSNDIFITAEPSRFLNLSGGGIAFYPTSGGGYVVMNEDGGDADFRIEGVGDQNLFFVDASTDRVGIGTNAPSVLFDVDGAGKFGQITVDNLVLNGNTLSSTSGNIILSANSNIVQVGADADTTIELGRAKLGSPTTDIMYLSHYDNNNNTDYAIKQLTSGRTCVNSKAGTQTDLCVNNVGQVNVDATKTNFVGYINQPGIFAEIYVADASTAQSIATGAGYSKSTAFTNNGQSSNCSADQANDKITITQTGRYRVSGSCSGTSGKANLTWRGAAFLNGVEQDQVHWKRKMTTTTDSGDMSFTGFVDVTSVPWDLDFRLRHDDGANQNFTAEYANLNVEYMGST